MVLLPSDIMALLMPFAPLFSSRVWRHVPVLVAGAILAPGRRMVSSLLRVVGLGQLATFQTYHRVLNRAKWSSLGASRILFGLLVTTSASQGQLVVGIDETIERRRGQKITASGIYRDPVRSSRRHFVKVRGLRWICATLLVPIPWATRVWALLFLTVLAPSERVAKRRRRRFKPLTTWARQMIRQVHRWAPARRVVVVGDRGYAALELLDAVRTVATVVVRLRLDARLFTPPPARMPGQKGRPRLVGDRLPNLTVHAQDATADWIRLTIPRWYGERERPIEVLSQTAVWYSTGYPPAIHRYPSAGCSSATRSLRSPPKRCSAPTWTLIRSTSAPGSSCAGNWRSPSTRCGPTWVSKHSASGLTGRSCARRQPSWGSSRW
jgi:hypothetical protein